MNNTARPPQRPEINNNPSDKRINESQAQNEKQKYMRRDTVQTSTQKQSQRYKYTQNPPKQQDRARLSENDGREKIVRYKGTCDRVFLVLVLVMVCLGVFMAYSASYAYSVSLTGHGYKFIFDQVIFVILGIAVMIIISRIDTSIIQRFAPAAYIVMILLLVAVLIYGTAEGVAKRWISIFGITIQPSEIAKTCLILMLAINMEKFKEKIVDEPDWKINLTYGLLRPGIFYILPIVVLMALEKHLSGIVIILAIAAMVMVAGGIDLKRTVFPFLGIVAVLAVFAVSVPYTRARITSWLNPEADPLGSNWQTLQGMRAIGSGGLLGLGPTNSRQKHMYVSQPQNDFIFSIYCEEFGFIGALALIVLFVFFIVRGYKIASRAPDMFSSLVVMGIISKVGLQACLNMGVVSGLLPNTGISLPFFSCGGSAMIMLMAEMGIVLSVSRFTGQDR